MKDRCVYVKQSDCWISFPFPAARLAYGSVNYKIPIIKSKASKAQIEITVYHEFVRCSIDRSCLSLCDSVSLPFESINYPKNASISSPTN